jgi:threonine dehydrogenase-like Zn-dependent dehydrogenase
VAAAAPLEPVLVSRACSRRPSRPGSGWRPTWLRACANKCHGVELPGEELFFSNVHLHGGPSPVRRFLPELIDLIWNRQVDPGKVFDLSLPLKQAAEGYRAMDQRRAIKTLLSP